jgi:two-component system response regulator AtoC
MARARQAGVGEDGGGARPVSGETILASWVAADPRSLALLEQVKKIAPASSTVLVGGESGTGKDLLAEMLHYLGAHPEQPLVKIDCASLPLELVESELFGYEKGAFTGASQAKPGRLELAGAGTLVLDEIAALSPAIQAKLLRVIEERRFERLGGGRPLKVEARMIALTHVDLERAVAERAFREDLYYRLNVIPLLIPPLRERRADIRPLVAHLLKRLAEVYHKPRLAAAPAALAALEQYAWPGNVRELRNLLERAVALGGGGEIGLDDLPPQVRRAAAPGGESKRSLEEVERAYIAEVLDAARGKKGRAAEILGISRKTLLEKRKKYKL